MHAFRGWLDEQGIEFEDGAVYREESKDMAARIRAGELFEADRPAP